MEGKSIYKIHQHLFSIFSIKDIPREKRHKKYSMHKFYTKLYEYSTQKLYIKHNQQYLLFTRHFDTTKLFIIHTIHQTKILLNPSTKIKIQTQTKTPSIKNPKKHLKNTIVGHNSTATHVFHGNFAQLRQRLRSFARRSLDSWTSPGLAGDVSKTRRKGHYPDWSRSLY